MNPKYNELVQVMGEYDSAPIGSVERSELGCKIDKLASKCDERDRISIAHHYQENKK